VPQLEKLWDAILTASRVLETNDPIAEWNNHMAKMARNNAILNGHRFKTLHFKNGLGTDLSIELAEDHIWAGGGEHSEKGIEFAPIFRPKKHSQ
jgi:aminopeptidase